MEKMVKREVLASAYKGKKVFLTGHTGFKGSWLTLMLQSLGAEVKGYSLEPLNKNDLYHKIDGDSLCDSTIADISDREQLTSELLELEPDFVIHMAAQALVLDSYTNPVETYDTNVMGTIYVLDALRSLKKPCSSILITTDKVYWNFERNEPYKEHEQLGGYDPYSNSKACADLAINSYQLSFLHPEKYREHMQGIATVRSGNVIGGGDWAENRIIPDCIRSLIKNEKITVRNPFAVRPWQHVLDPLYGYLLLGAKLQDQPVEFSETFNFGPYEQDVLTVENLVNIALDEWGSGSFATPELKNKPHEAGLLKLSIDKAQSKLKWNPTYNAETAIRKTISWYKNSVDNEAEFTLNQINDFLNTEA